MILRSILLQDFGLYAGRQLIDLVPRSDAGGPRPVVLVGGKNGAGKTTLLEAVRLALYGRRALGHRVGQSDYENYLRRRIHASRDGERADSSSVGLEFDYAEAGEIHRYKITRSWTAKGVKLNEDLLLEKDGKTITSVPRDEWQYFLHDLIPPGVSQLFFFDGEKISEIAEGERDDGLADAMRGLLGIDVIARLRTDLGLYLARQNRAEDSESATRLDQLLARKAELDSKIAEAVEDTAELRSQRDAQSANAERVRRRFVAEGGDAANQRASLEASRDETRRQIVRREVELRELANGLLPLAYATKLLSRVERHLADEDARSRVNSDTASALLAELRTWQASVGTATWTEGHWTDLERFAASQGEVPVGGPLSDAAERDALRRRIAQVRASTSSHSALLAHELAELTGQLNEAEASLVRADGHAAGVLLDEMAVSEQRVGATEATLKAREEELRGLEYQRATLLREQERLLESQTAVGMAMERAKLAAMTSQTLARYEQRLLELKVEQLRQSHSPLQPPRAQGGPGGGRRHRSRHLRQQAD